MPRIIVFTADLPYFPGKMGIDFFNLRFLATRHEVTVIGPLYDFAPIEGVTNLEKAVTSLLAWPRPTDAAPLFIQDAAVETLPPWVHRLPVKFRRWLLNRLLGIQGAPADAYERLAIQSNCAPHFLTALRDASCKAFIFIQSNLAPCLDYLPGPGARFVYFHDVRSDYLARTQAFGRTSGSARDLAAIKRQEQRVCSEADGVGFVSRLDEQRAQQLFHPKGVSGVGPIPVDTEYFKPAPADWPGRPEPTVLFTGHLSHPPNVDAIRYFLAEIWPTIRKAVSDARFVAAGMLPAEELKQLASTVEGFDLHPNVPDIRPFFWDARVYVVPMRFGGGVRQKIFEAWSMQVPVVCTTMAAEGIAARHGENCWLEDTPASFAARVVVLLQIKSEPPILLAAKKQVEASNSISAASTHFAQLVEKTIATKRRRPFRLLYDLRWMSIGNAGGVEQMTHELVAALAQLDHSNHYRLSCPRSTFYEWQFPSSFQVKCAFTDDLEKGSERLHAAVSNDLAKGLGLPSVLTPPMRTLGALHRMDFDLVHSIIGHTHHDLAAFPGVLTMHDLQHIYYPEFFSPADWQERDRLYRDSAARARHIFCISENTRQDLHRHFGISFDKMTTVWNIPSRQVWQALSVAVREKLLDQLGLRHPFLFFPGHCWPHKNHTRLLEAFALIRVQLPQGMKLVFTGRAFPADHPASQVIRTHNLETHVIHLGYRSPLEMQALYQSCFMLVFPSLFEGFGMPVAEAIIAGKPVVCSNRTSLPEIAGDAALMFDPTNVAEMASRILAVANDPQCYSHLAEASRRRRPVFSGRMSAIKTLAVYQRVYEELYT